MRSIIITAGGHGKRMLSATPKQFIELKGRPILFYTIEKFLEFDPSIEIILVLPSDHIPTWQNLCKKHNFTHILKIAEGGKERFHSVKNGLALATGDIVGIHDSVRPFVSVDVIDACYKEAAEKGSAIPIMSPKESMRQLKGNKWVAVDRSEYVFVQTPQVFSRGYLQTAYEQEYKSFFTDDASVVEASGREIHTVEGNEENIKITTPSDLKWAELFI